MSIRLRPHHLLCLLTYAGKGYSAAFTANYDVIAARIAGGEAVTLVDGPDDICAPLLGDAEPHCWRDSVVERDRLALSDVSALLGMPLAAGQSLSLTTPMLARMRRGFAETTVRTACSGCEWSDLCTAIAGDDYAGTAIPHC